MNSTETISGTLTAAMNQELARDKKLWRELVTEAAEKGVEPDDAIVRRLGIAWDLEGAQATNAFIVDVAAMQTIANETKAHKKAQKQVDAFVEEHGEIKELKIQLSDMHRQARELERTIRLADHRETGTHRRHFRIQRIKSQTKRIYGDLQND